MLPDEQLRLACLEMAARGGLPCAEDTLEAARKFYEFAKAQEKRVIAEKVE